MIPLAFMFVHCERESEDHILDRLKTIPGVAFGFKVSGVYDLVIKVETDSVEQFTHAISEIRKSPGLLNTDTMIGFK